MKRKIEIWMAIFFIFSSLFVSLFSTNVVMSKKIVTGRKIVIDPGHGGGDPGKVAKDGTLEKDVNLEIALLLGEYLKKQGIEVYYTRESDMGLYHEDDKNKKMADLTKRCQLINNIKPDLVISIHQNSYENPSVHGAQVFYYHDSENGQKLAECIQNSIIQTADGSNKRKAKANNTYYILKNTAYPLVIIECGFLSNSEECRKLCDKKYQEKLVEGMYQGIVAYFQKCYNDIYEYKSL